MYKEALNNQQGFTCHKNKPTKLKIYVVGCVVLYSHLCKSMNGRIHFFIKICISHTLFSKGLMFMWCVTGTQLLLLTRARCVIFRNPLTTSSTSWLGLLNRRSLRATALSFQAFSQSGLSVTK